MRNYVLCYINGQRYTINGKQALMNASDFLRYELNLKGTKIVCAEGDCGACTVLRHFYYQDPSFTYAQAINSCIIPMFLLDCHHLISVEGLGPELHPIQEKMIDCHGSQCGYCTPGFVMALAGMCEKTKFCKKSIDEKKVKNYLTGNLCRCTGYEPIIDAGKCLDPKKYEYLLKKFHSKKIEQDIKKHVKDSVEILEDDFSIACPVSLSDLKKFQKKSVFSIFSSSTDLGVQINKGKDVPKKLLSLNLIKELYSLKETRTEMEIGAKVSYTDIQDQCKKSLPEFCEFLNIFASPQIKNFATLVGNIANGSPIGDSLPFLLIANARLEIISPKGTREVPMNKFYLGYKKMDLKPGEVITKVTIPKRQPQEKVSLYKISTRKDLDISAVNAGFYLQQKNNQIQEARISFGGVGPTVLRLPKTEKFLQQKNLSRDVALKSIELIHQEVKPLSDHRGSLEYRHKICENLFRKFYFECTGEHL